MFQNHLKSDSLVESWSQRLPESFDVVALKLLLCLFVFWLVVDFGCVPLVFETGFCILGRLGTHSDPSTSAFRWLG